MCVCAYVCMCDAHDVLVQLRRNCLMRAPVFFLMCMYVLFSDVLRVQLRRNCLMHASMFFLFMCVYARMFCVRVCVCVCVCVCSKCS